MHARPRTVLQQQKAKAERNQEEELLLQQQKTEAERKQEEL